ncbi:MAG: RDD family protein [Dehalococcoidia bacterium]|nr:RDD family protein [Dehalococcoidia bacterium]
MKNKRKEYALEYAGFWIRFAASLIDLVILLAGLYILYCVISQSFSWIFPEVPKVISSLKEIPSEARVSGRIIWLMATILLVFIIGSTIYYVACWASTGQTVGKICLGIKIIRTDSSRLDLRFAFTRFLGCVLCTATLGIGFILIAFDSHKQGLHDRMADTYVVKLPVKQVVLDRSLAGGGIG